MNKEEKKEKSVVPLEKAFKLEGVIQGYLQDKSLQIKFVSALSTVFSATPMLKSCDPETIRNAFIKCLEYRLFPNGVSGEAYIIPYGKEAQFQLGYQGIITILGRAGYNIRSQIVYENDEFFYEEGENAKLVHRPIVFKEKGKPIGVYAVSEKNNVKTFKVLSAEDILKFRNYSKSKDSKFSAWTNDPELYMWRKTAIKQLAKLLYKEENQEIFKAIDDDNKDSIIYETIQDKADKIDVERLKLKKQNKENFSEDQEFEKYLKNESPNLKVE
jgi:recombination protein RecT